MEQSVIQKATINANAVWCDSVCASHGLQTRWESEFWVCEDRPPTFYPDLVLLTPAADPMRAGKSATAIKDSYNQLDLEDPYFKLFTAEWYFTDADRFREKGSGCSVVRTETELHDWCEQWGGMPEGEEIFTQKLLSDDRSFFLKSSDGTAGIAACLSEQMGMQIWSISNLFGGIEGLRDCFAELARRTPDAYITGYGDPEELAMLTALGFMGCGPLSVWLAR